MLIIYKTPLAARNKNMHEQDLPSKDQDPQSKGYYLPHYEGSDLPSAMKYPAWDQLPNHLPDLATMQPLGERRASDPEFIRLVQAYNAAGGERPQTHDDTLLESVTIGTDDSTEVLASMATHDEKSNRIVYLKSDKFIVASELRNFTNGRDALKNGRSSKELINKYKDMSYDTMPPVQHVTAYYEVPTGNTYFALVGDGAHRLAGAVRRGDVYIPSISVSFMRLETNSISEQLEQMAAQEHEAPKHRFGGGILKRLGIRKP